MPYSLLCSLLPHEYVPFGLLKLESIGWWHKATKSKPMIDGSYVEQTLFGCGGWEFELFSCRMRE